MSDRTMTNEEAAAILESEAEYLYSQDEPYSRQAFKMAIEALQRTTCGKCANYECKDHWCYKFGADMEEDDFCSYAEEN